MTKYVLDISGGSIPSFNQGDASLIFDSLSELWLYITNNYYSGTIYISIHKVEYASTDSNMIYPISGTATEITYKDMEFVNRYVLSFNNVLSFEFKTKIELVNFMKKVRPISDATTSYTGNDNWGWRYRIVTFTASTQQITSALSNYQNISKL